MSGQTYKGEMDMEEERLELWEAQSPGFTPETKKHWLQLLPLGITTAASSTSVSGLCGSDYRVLCTGQPLQHSLSLRAHDRAEGQARSLKPE